MKQRLHNAILMTVMGMILSCTSGKPQAEEIIQYYGTGEISRRHTMVNGKKEGRMTEYNPDGSIRSERDFKDDIQVGKSVFYYPGGEIKEVQYYENGQIHGGDTVFYTNGTPQFLRNFNQGQLDGYIRKWDSTGVVIYEARYENFILVEVNGEPIDRDTISPTQ